MNLLYIDISLLNLIFRWRINLSSFGIFSVIKSLIKLQQLRKSSISFKFRKLISLFLICSMIFAISFSVLFKQKIIEFSFDLNCPLINIKKSIYKSLLKISKLSSTMDLLFKKFIQSINIGIFIVLFSTAL